MNFKKKQYENEDTKKRKRENEGYWKKERKR